ncbi:cysteine-rich PDZ-binding protein-like [Mytilus trossulus]
MLNSSCSISKNEVTVNSRRKQKQTKMVCEKCEKKLGKVITPDPWKTGARNITEGGGRKIGENKALTAKKNRFAPYEGFAKCKICRSSVHQKGSHYCQGCAYKKGICAMCGKKIIETKNYRQTSV